MKEHPILFSAPMVKALKEGRKTMTRRVVKPQPLDLDQPWPDANSHVTFADLLDSLSYQVYCGACPYGQPGDRLWVRETFRLPASLESADLKFNWGQDQVYYRADQDDVYAATDWKPSIFMPRWASRFTLEITQIGLEEIQDISEWEAKQEGVVPNPKALDPCTPYPARQSYRTAFRLLWDELNAKRGFGWDTFPWVWCISFKVV